MKLKRILWKMRNDFQGEYECEFCGAIKTDKSADSYMDAYYFDNVIPNMFCPKCGKNSNGKIKEIKEMTKEDFSITYENNIFYCTKNNTKWISVDGKKWYCEEKRIAELEAQIEKMKCCCNCMWSDCDGKLGNPPCKYCDFNNNWKLRR